MGNSCLVKNNIVTFNEVRINYLPPTKFTRGGGGPYTGPQPRPLFWPSSVQGPAPPTGPSPNTPRHVQTCSTWTTLYRDPLPPQTCSNLFKLDLTLQGSPACTQHVHTCSLCSADCRRVDGWNSTCFMGFLSFLRIKI